MARVQRRRSPAGFSLIELAVVVALGAVLVLLLVFPLGRAVQRGREVQLMLDGRDTARTLQAAPARAGTVVEPELQLRSDPEHGEFATSTEYFRYCVTGGMLNVKFAFFSGPGILPAAGTNPAEFTGRNNAWNVVADVNDATVDGIPFLFTKNLDITALRPAGDYAAYLKTDVDSFGNPVPAFRKGAVCVVAKGGSACIVKAEQLQTNFCPPVAAATNRVLRAGK